ncbi:hypothetical protein GCM10022626_10050 [[Pseudomonas] carboxydohydrogena]
MHQQHLARLQIGQKVFGAAPQSGHFLAIEAGGEILLQRKAQIAPMGRDTDDPRPFHGGYQTATNRFNLG